MGLTNILLGELIEPSEGRNTIVDQNISGVDITKRFIPTRANLEGTDLSRYKVVAPKNFAANFMHIGRDIKLPVAYNSTDENIIVSPAYTVFRVKSEKILDDYLFILMNSTEFDRLTWFYTDSSVRGNLDWSRFCSIPLNIPSPTVLKKAVDSYNAISANLASYTDGLDDLKLTCDIYMDNIKKSFSREFIGTLLEETDLRNKGQKINNVLGINIEKGKLFDHIRRHLKSVGGDGKGGTYFGATGCGKTFTMLFLARQLALRDSETLGNPTIIVITDREDLDTQASKLFCVSTTYLNEENVRSMENRQDLKNELGSRQSGGVFITTIQKFCADTGLLSGRSNIICFSDEAHRTQVNTGSKLTISDEKGVKLRLASQNICVIHSPMQLM